MPLMSAHTQYTAIFTVVLGHMGPFGARIPSELRCEMEEAKLLFRWNFSSPELLRFLRKEVTAIEGFAWISNRLTCTVKYGVWPVTNTLYVSFCEPYESIILRLLRTALCSPPVKEGFQEKYNMGDSLLTTLPGDLVHELHKLPLKFTDKFSVASMRGMRIAIPKLNVSGKDYVISFAPGYLVVDLGQDTHLAVAGTARTAVESALSKPSPLFV